VSLAEAPSGFNFSTPVAIEWGQHDNLCMEVEEGSLTFEGLTLNIRGCSPDSNQFIIESAQGGQMKWAHSPGYCVSATGGSNVQLKECANTPAAQTEFTFSNGRIHLTSDMNECMAVDSRHTVGNYHPVKLYLCDAYDGDAIDPPAPEDYLLAVAWQLQVTTTQTTVTFTAPEPDPSKHLPSQIMLKSVHGSYVVAERGGGIFANRPWADDWEKFKVVDKGEGNIALKSFHGKFLTADITGLLMANAQSSDSPRTTFEAMFVPTGALVLKSSYGKYVCAEPSGVMRADRSSFDDWEEFEVLDVADAWPEHVAIKTARGKYVRGQWSGLVTAQGVWPLDEWERLHVTSHSDEIISLRLDHGEYVSVQPDGSIRASKEVGNAEKLKITHLDDGNFTIQDHLGKYLWAGDDGEMKAGHTQAVGAQEKFEVVFLG